MIRTMGRTAAGNLGRYHHGSPTASGSGLIGNLARKVFSSGFRRVINSAKQANIPQKITDLAVRGAATAREHLG